MKICNVVSLINTSPSFTCCFCLYLQETLSFFRNQTNSHTKKLWLDLIAHQWKEKISWRWKQKQQIKGVEFCNEVFIELFIKLLADIVLTYGLNKVPAPLLSILFVKIFWLTIIWYYICTKNTLHKKWSSPLRICLVNVEKNQLKTTDLFRFTREIINWKLQFLGNDTQKQIHV